MCDTLYVKTEQGFWFAKNSDRSPNEPNLTLFYPRKTHTEKTVKTTYLEIDQVQTTNALLLIAPSWMWGGEMGINEHNVCIGNEAIFTKSVGKKKPSLIGMDYLRLALERASTARLAVDVIVSLLKVYGQGGNCGFDKPFYYDNSYLIADPTEAFVLETVGKEAFVKKVLTHTNISNRISVADEFDVSLLDQKLFFKKNSEPIFTFFSKSKSRSCAVREQLELDGSPDIFKVMSVLKTHPHNQKEKQRFMKGSLGSPCMHASMLGDHTTASMIIELRNGQPYLYLTSSSTPCKSLFKPVLFGEVVPPVFSNAKRSAEYWLKQERIRRALFQGIIDSQEYDALLGETQSKIFEAQKAFQNGSIDKAKFLDSIAKIESAWVSKYSEAVKTWETQVSKSKGIFHKYDAKLGANIFERDLKKRTEKKKGA